MRESEGPSDHAEVVSFVTVGCPLPQILEVLAGGNMSQERLHVIELVVTRILVGIIRASKIRAFGCRLEFRRLVSTTFGFAAPPTGSTKA